VSNTPPPPLHLLTQITSYCSCIAIRLAYFNVVGLTGNYYHGMPSDTNMIVFGIASLLLRPPHLQVGRRAPPSSSSRPRALSRVSQGPEFPATVGSDVIILWCCMMLCRFDQSPPRACA
jgi:hypothetical protein